MRTTTSLIWLAASGSLFLGACGDDGGPSGTPDAQVQPPDAMAGAPDAGTDPGAVALWEAISGDNDYTAWDEFPGHAGVTPYTGHGATHRRVFVNDTAKADLASLPDGSIIVKENLTADDPSALAAITVMQRQGSDWYWAKFSPAGDAEVAGTTADLDGMGCVSSGCHGDMTGTQDDAAFLNNDFQDAAQIYAEITASGAEYTGWEAFGAETTPPVNQDSSGVHGDYNRTFINDVANGDEANLPDGSILVKENLTDMDPDAQGALDSITIMERIDGFDTDNADWFYAKVMADGTIVAAGPKATVGCASDNCHGMAGGSDFVFSND